MNSRYALISEYFWLLVTLTTCGIAAYMFYTYGSGEWPYLIMVVMAVVMYAFRRMLRKRFEKNKTTK